MSLSDVTCRQYLNVQEEPVHGYPGHWDLGGERGNHISGAYGQTTIKWGSTAAAPLSQPQMGPRLFPLIFDSGCVTPFCDATWAAPCNKKWYTGPNKRPHGLDALAGLYQSQDPFRTETPPWSHMITPPNIRNYYAQRWTQMAGMIGKNGCQ